MAQKTAGAVTLGYEYLNAQGKNGMRNSLQGWHGVLEVNLTKKLGVYGDSANFYAAPQNIHSLTGGLIYKFHKFGPVTLSGFTEAGESRDSDAGVIGYAFEYAIGPSFTLKLNKHVSLEVCPGEYVLTVPKGETRNNYAAHAGFNFPFGHK